MAQITNPATGGASSRPTDRAARTTGVRQAWKSGLMIAGMGVVLVGWAVLARNEAANPAVSTPQAQAAAAQAAVAVAQAPVSAGQAPAAGSNSTSRQGLSSGSVPAMPQAPAFRRPLTRSRGS